MDERHGLAASEHARIAHGIARRAHLGSRHAMPIEHDRSGRQIVLRRRERLDEAVQFVDIRDTGIAGLEARHRLARSGRPIAAKRPCANGSVGAQTATQPSRLRYTPNGARRGTIRPVRCGMPHRSSKSNGSPATIDVRAPSIETSTCWPVPCALAAAAPPGCRCTPNSGATMSATGTPTRTGPSPGSPGRHHQAAERLDDGVHRLAARRGPCQRRSRITSRTRSAGSPRVPYS